MLYCYYFNSLQVNDHYLFISGGDNIRLLRALHPETFFQLRGRRGSGELMIYSANERTLEEAKIVLRRYQGSNRTSIFF